MELTMKITAYLDRRFDLEEVWLPPEDGLGLLNQPLYAFYRRIDLWSCLHCVRANSLSPVWSWLGAAEIEYTSIASPWTLLILPPFSAKFSVYNLVVVVSELLRFPWF